MPKKLNAIAMERCIGCHSCMFACARLVHNALSWSRTGIRIRSRGGLTGGFEAIYCLACPEPACVAACPSGAMRERKGGGMRYRRELCLRCGDCARACPVNAIVLDGDSGEPFVCLHCGHCVPFCPHACLAMTQTERLELP